MPNWWVIYAEDTGSAMTLLAKGFLDKEFAKTWADNTPGIVVVDIAEGEKKD